MKKPLSKDAQVRIHEFITMVKEMTEEELSTFILDCRSQLSGKELDTLNKMIKIIKE